MPVRSAEADQELVESKGRRMNELTTSIREALAMDDRVLVRSHIVELEDLMAEFKEAMERIRQRPA